MGAPEDKFAHAKKMTPHAILEQRKAEVIERLRIASIAGAHELTRLGRVILPAIRKRDWPFHLFDGGACGRGVFWEWMKPSSDKPPLAGWIVNSSQEIDSWECERHHSGIAILSNGEVVSYQFTERLYGQGSWPSNNIDPAVGECQIVGVSRGDVRRVYSNMVYPPGRIPEGTVEERENKLLSSLPWGIHTGNISVMRRMIADLP